jgi:hypothetical protein
VALADLIDSPRKKEKKKKKCRVIEILERAGKAS